MKALDAKGLGLIPGALMDAIRQLPSPAFLRVLFGTLAITLLVTGPFLLIFAALAWVIELATPASLSIPWLGEVSFLGVFTQGLVSKTSWIFWTYVIAPIVLALIGLFLETIVDAVEARFYPALPRVRARSLAQMAGYAVRFFAMMLAVSLAAFVASFFAGFLAPVLFVAANGYLIGKEYYETVALRRMSEAEAARLTRANLPVLWVLGAGLALAMNVPFVNLVVPLIGVAAYTHLYHRLGQA
ncbi:MAG TPA: hypothetical protein ENJ52_08030 [Aliiroseovarius sp.]|nr:hypothetical protein [Aliiroseovarius sp.]